MKGKLLFSILLGLALLFSMAGPVFADGIIIPPLPPCGPRGPRECPPFPRPMSQLEIRYHHVTVRITDQVAVTHIDQAFHNPNDFPVEGTYVFPLPAGAAVNNFTLWVDGKSVEGKVLSAEEARRTYEETVSQMRDPALLEYIGRGALQASIFPIPPDGERRIELEYSQVLTANNGLVHYSYPLNTEKFSSQPLQDVSIKVDVSSTWPLRAVYSSSHTVEVNREDDNHATATYEASNVLPDSDFDLYYSAGNAEAFHLISYRDPGDPTDPDGFFLLLLSPKPGAVNRVVAKDVLLVLDHSGSMDGEKFQQAQAALRYILKHLNPGDRFHLTAFSSDVQMYANQLLPASDADAALDWVNGLSAQGSTDINRALLESVAVADKERPTYLIFLTDGLPTEGVTESQQILDNFKKSARDNIRLFAFGVGYDVDTFLLDSLSGEHHGLSTYVRPGESLDEVLSSFYERISTPVLTNLRLDFGKMQVYDVYPNPLPDLFTGSQVVVTGRYRKGGTFDASLYGNVNGLDQAYRYPEQTVVEDSRPIRNAPTGLPRLWATRKIGNLLNEIRLKGNNKEIIDQIVRLSIRYGIVTPYTSYLVTEPMPLGAEAQSRVADNTYNQLQAAPAAPSSGQEAVQKAAGQGALSQAEAPAAVPVDAGQKVRVVGSRAFVNTDGVWTDTTFDPEKMKPIQVEFLSPDYFKLAQSSPEIGAALALGERVIVVTGATAYEVVSQGTPTGPVTLPATLSPAPTDSSPSVEATSEPVVIATGGVHPQPSKTVAATQPGNAPKGSGFSASLIALSCLGGLITIGAALWVFKSK